jgi:hypothetical protein
MLQNETITQQITQENTQQITQENTQQITQEITQENTQQITQEIETANILLNIKKSGQEISVKNLRKRKIVKYF